MAEISYQGLYYRSKMKKEIPWTWIIISIIILVAVIVLTNSCDWIFKKNDEFGYP